MVQFGCFETLHKASNCQWHAMEDMLLLKLPCSMLSCIPCIPRPIDNQIASTTLPMQEHNSDSCVKSDTFWLLLRLHLLMKGCWAAVIDGEMSCARRVSTSEVTVCALPGQLSARWLVAELSVTTGRCSACLENQMGKVKGELKWMLSAYGDQGERTGSL